MHFVTDSIHFHMYHCRCFTHEVPLQKSNHGGKSTLFRTLAPANKYPMSQKITAAITCVGGYVPNEKLTNADLEKMVDTTDEWIRTRTGVAERRILKGDGKG